MSVAEYSVIRPCRGLIAPGAGFLLAAGAAPALGQCVPVWSARNGGAQAGIGGSEVFDEDGPGPMPPRLFAGGGFPIMFAGVFVNGIARWDGWVALPVGSGLVTTALGLEEIRRIGPDAQPLPTGVYVGGDLDSAGGVPVLNLARWDGFEWFDVGGGVGGHPVGGHPFVIREFDEDGPGPGGFALFVGGKFHMAGGIPAEALARWNGQAWSVVGGGLLPAVPGQDAGVYALEVFDDDGRGARQPALYVAGSFKWAGGIEVNHIARWDGSSWEALGAGIAGTPVESLCVFDEDGPGPGREVLFVGGDYVSPGGTAARDIARWDGTAWSVVGGGAVGGGVRAMAVFDDDGPGPRKPALFIAGYLGGFVGGGFANNIARWDGQQWSLLGTGLTGAIAEVFTLTVYDEDSPGPNPGGLYVGGYFTFAGGVPVNHIARWGCPLPPRCDANCSRDFHPVTGAHVLTIADFTCFQARYLLQDPWADCNADTQLTIADFTCFQNKFVAGCE